MSQTTTTEMREYAAEFGVYINCSVIGVEERTIEAASVEEAEAMAEELAREIEEEIISESPEYKKGDDVWVDLEELCDLSEDSDGEFENE